VVDAANAVHALPLRSARHPGAEFSDRTVHIYALLGDPALQTLKRLWAAWKRIAHRIGDFQARVLLTVIYAVLVLPFGVMISFFSDSLHIKKRPTNWIDHPQENNDLKWARNQG
jgi:hypothetical protein